MPAPLVVPRLPECKWYVAILDHVLNLSPHYTTASAQLQNLFLNLL